MARQPLRAVDLDRDMTHVIPTGTTRDSEFLFRRMEALTFAATGSTQGTRVLDSAAGLGQDSRALARSGARSVCAEPSRRMIELAKLVAAKEPAPAPGSVQWARAWSESLPFRSGSFDVVLANLMAPLLVERSAEIRRLIAPGGALVLSGLLIPDLPAVRSAYSACGTAGELVDGEWVALVYEDVG